jgi:hypothetical protein
MRPIKFKQMFVKLEDREYNIKIEENEYYKLKALIERAYKHMGLYKTHPNF